MLPGLPAPLLPPDLWRMIHDTAARANNMPATRDIHTRYQMLDQINTLILQLRFLCVSATS